jgi:hypothetical protein
MYFKHLITKFKRCNKARLAGIAIASLMASSNAFAVPDNQPGFEADNALADLTRLVMLESYNHNPRDFLRSNSSDANCDAFGLNQLATNDTYDFLNPTSVVVVSVGYAGRCIDRSRGFDRRFTMVGIKGTASSTELAVEGEQGFLAIFGAFTSRPLTTLGFGVNSTPNTLNHFADRLDDISGHVLGQIIPNNNSRTNFGLRSVQSFRSLSDSRRGLNNRRRTFNDGPVIITGHSLGGAVAALYGLLMSTQPDELNHINIVTFNAPKAFTTARAVNLLHDRDRDNDRLDVFFIQRTGDPVQSVPPSFRAYRAAPNNRFANPRAAFIGSPTNHKRNIYTGQEMNNFANQSSWNPWRFY